VSPAPEITSFIPRASPGPIARPAASLSRPTPRKGLAPSARVSDLPEFDGPEFDGPEFDQRELDQRKFGPHEFQSGAGNTLASSQRLRLAALHPHHGAA
jgi:hypothetical protein